MALAKKLIVHIGQPKTGTTTLQAALARSRQNLLRDGILYPDAGKSANHTPAAFYLTDKAFVPALELRTLGGDEKALYEKSRKAWENVLSHIGKSTPETVVLSSETIYDFGLRNSHAAPGFLDKIAAIAEDITIVCYLREPASLYLSLKQQNLKYARADPAPEKNSTMRKALEPFMRDDRVKLEVHKFSRSALHDGDVVADFVGRYLPETAQSKISTVPRDLNTSISAEMMLICEDLLAGAAHPKLAPHRDFPMSLSAALPFIDRATDGFQPARLRYGIANLIHAQSEDLPWLEKTFGISFGKPNEHAIDGAVDPAQLVSTRDICDIDEDRYARLLERFPSPSEVRVASKKRKRARWIANTPRRMKRNVLRALNAVAPRQG